MTLLQKKLFPLTSSDSERKTQASNKEKTAGGCQIATHSRGVGWTVGQKENRLIFNRI